MRLAFRCERAGEPGMGGCCVGRFGSTCGSDVFFFGEGPSYTEVSCLQGAMFVHARLCLQAEICTHDTRLQETIYTKPTLPLPRTDKPYPPSSFPIPQPKRPPPHKQASSSTNRLSDPPASLFRALHLRHRSIEVLASSPRP